MQQGLYKEPYFKVIMNVYTRKVPAFIISAAGGTHDKQYIILVNVYHKFLESQIPFFS